MGFLKELWKFRSSVILTVTPVLLLLIFVAFPKDVYTEAACAYVICLMAIFWITEVVPLAVTSLLPLVLYPLFGVVSAYRVSVEYLKDVNVLFLGGLTVAVAVEHWNLHKRIALKVLCWVGAKPRWLLFGFMITTAFLSMWISNVATTAMMVPIAQAVLDELDEKEKEQSADDSGVGTPRDGKTASGRGYLASSVTTKESHIAEEIGNIGAAQALGNRLARASTRGHDDLDRNNGFVGYQPVSGEESTAMMDTGLGYPPIQITEPDTPTPPKSPTDVSSSHLVVEMPLDDTGESPASSTAQLIRSQPKMEMGEFNEKLAQLNRKKGLSKALTICVCYAANIGGTATLTGTGPNLIVAGQFKTTYPSGPEIDFGSWAVFAFPGMAIFLIICWLWLQYIFLDIKLKDMLPCPGRRNEKMSREEKRMKDVIKRQYEQLGKMSFAETSVLIFFIVLALLWLSRDPGFVSGWGQLPIFKPKFVSDATVAMAIAFLLFVFPSEKPNCFCCSNDKKTGPVPPLLTWTIVQKKMAWNVILLLGGGFAMALGAKESGLSALIGMKLQPLHALSPFLANLICCVVVSAMTQCTSNTATATVFLPILAELAEVLNLNPLLLMLPATLITSYAFMLPVSTPPNAIAYSYQHLTMWDMIKAGSLMNVVGLFIALASVYTTGSIAFSLHDSCPSWINSTHCGLTIVNSTINNTTLLPLNISMAT